MNQEIYDKTIAVCQKFIDDVNEQNDKLIVVLHAPGEWFETVKTKCKHNQNLITISNTKECSAFIHQNGCKKLYVQLNIEGESGIDWAEKLDLKEYFAQLFFISDEEPSLKNRERIEKLGGRFVMKHEALTTIIYPKEAGNGIHSRTE